MSCGTKITPRFDTFSERATLADEIEREDYLLSRRVRNGECLSYYDLLRAESILEDASLKKFYDYREEHCACSEERPESLEYEDWTAD